MFRTHRKLIISQLAAIMAVGAFIMAFLRFQQNGGVWQEQMFGSFALFGILLLGVEIKCILDWMRTRKAALASPLQNPQS